MIEKLLFNLKSNIFTHEIIKIIIDTKSRFGLKN